MPTPRSTDGLRVSSRVELEITALVAGGEGLGRVDGRVVFVPGTAPGDLVLVEIVQITRTFARARVVELRRASPVRREPRCRHVGACGGCSWQHVTAEAQRDAKAAIVRDALQRLAGVTLSQAIEVVHGEEFGYRTRADLSIARAKEGAPALGYRAAHSHAVVSVSECPVLCGPLEHELARVNAEPTCIPRVATSARLSAGENGARVIFLDADQRPLIPRAADGIDDAADFELERTLEGIRHSFDARAFWQNHGGLHGELVRRATRDVRSAVAWDLYAGAGMFALHLARACGKVVAVEEDLRSAERGRKAARDNGIRNVEFVGSDVATFLRTCDEAPGTVLLDPPRRGLDEDVVAELVRIGPRRVRYVSCDPATLARDVRRLVEGGYAFESVVALDLFPQTPHVETIVDLTSTRSAPANPS